MINIFNNKHFSLIIPCYNEAPNIKKLFFEIEKYLKNFKYEIIFINDGSNDRTDYALELFGDQIVKLNNKKNLGLTKSLNIGIKKSKGKFIIRLDSDDYVNTNYLSLMSYYLYENPDFNAVACDYLLVDKTLHLYRLKENVY